MKALLVGQAPGKNGGPSAFAGSKGSARILRRLGLLPGENVDAVNLLGYFPGKQGKGDAFPLDEARDAARRFDFSPYGTIILAGHRVAAAFGFGTFPYLEPFLLDGHAVFVLPHPSGINRWWNDPKNVARASRALRRLPGIQEKPTRARKSRVREDDMGTRADFYVGRGADAEWLGSIAWDGDPGSIPDEVKGAMTEPAYRAEVAVFLARCDDATRPADGWPWPWDDSQTTDYAYAFDGGKVWASRFGHAWFELSRGEPTREGDAFKEATPGMPDMRARKRVTLGPRSGLTVPVGSDL